MSIRNFNILTRRFCEPGQAGSSPDMRRDPMTLIAISIHTRKSAASCRMKFHRHQIMAAREQVDYSTALESNIWTAVQTPDLILDSLTNK
jgi:hypothetical protein